MGIREVVISMLFCLCYFAAENPVTSRTPSPTPTRSTYVERIPADKLRADLDYLFKILSEVPFKNPHRPSDRFKGAVCLLIGEPTFSSASNFAAAVKYFEMGTLIGQETGGTRDHYGQVLPIELPHSGLKGQVSTAHFIAVGGTEHPGGVKPDYAARQKPEDTPKDIDTVLEFTLGLIRNGGNVSDFQSAN